MFNDRKNIAIELYPKPSWMLASLLGVVHLFAVLALFWTDLPILIRLFLAVIIVANLLYVVCRYALLCLSTSLCYLRWNKDGIWELENLKGQRFETVLCRESIVLPWLVILRLRATSRPGCLAVLLGMESENAEKMRQLRIRLRLTSGS